MCEQRWRKAPGIKSSETMPKDLARAAKFNFGIEFETRADHDKYCEEQGLTPEVTQFDDIAKAACVTPDESDEPKLTLEEAESSRKNSIDMWDRWEAENLDPLPTTTLTSDELATVSDQIESELRNARTGRGRRLD